jgi:hypothetical protein
MFQERGLLNEKPAFHVFDIIVHGGGLNDRVYRVTVFLRLAYCF